MTVETRAPRRIGVGWEQIFPVAEQLWRQRAACKGLSGMPWTADVTPKESEQAAMRSVCDNCPVLLECALHAHERREEGGFWAGVWLPWRTGADSNAVYRWQRARAILRNRLAAIHTPARELPSDDIR